MIVFHQCFPKYGLVIAYFYYVKGITDILKYGHD
ncbi:hypothetical protein T03_1147 [Trichinella britovi]|uniref:Uncharacterized protein n=1 Tax=Trichinella britovi TaxID=45882 RepID=A0A0V1AHJ5_TRIBR|nr:hypothetical protein T03_1147 [Trichinella britovi]